MAGEHSASHKTFDNAIADVPDTVRAFDRMRAREIHARNMIADMGLHKRFLALTVAAQAFPTFGAAVAAERRKTALNGCRGRRRA